MKKSRPSKAALRAGSEGLGATFVEIRPKLRRLISCIVGPDCIEDIVQETFVRSYEASRKQEIRHPRSFMYRAARNIALNHLNRADNRLTTQVADFADPDVSIPKGDLEFDIEFESKERFLFFCRAVEKLPLQCRRVFILKRVYGLSQREVAEHLGISQSTVEKQVAKGITMCARFMEEMGYPVDLGKSRKSSGSRQAG